MDDVEGPREFPREFNVDKDDVEEVNDIVEGLR
jgi:hypothetical protein